MKRPSINFSQAGIKEFFFRHAEKLFLGIACVLIGLFFWMGFKTPKYTKTSPDQMLEKTVRAENRMKDANNWTKMAEHRIADTAAVMRIENAPKVDAKKYPYSILTGTVVATKTKRSLPEIVPPEKFDVKFFKAQVVLDNLKHKPSAGELARGVNGLPNSDLTYPSGHRYESFVYRPGRNRISSTSHKFLSSDVVVGMALISAKAQQSAFDQVFPFRRGYDDVRDTPEYVYLEVQRSTDENEPRQWKSITAHVHSVKDETAPPAKSVADPDSEAERVTLPIPPFLGIDYRDFATLPEITSEKFLDELKKKAKKADDQESTDQNDVFGGNEPAADEPKEQAAEADQTDPETPTYKLVRFYDLTNKQVGKKYYYRIRVWLRDPNNPDAIDVADAVSNAESVLGRGGGSGGGFAADDDPAPGGDRDGGGSGTSNKPKRDAKPLSEFDLSPEERNRIKNPPFEFPQDVEDSIKDLLKLAVPTEWVEATNPAIVSEGFETFVAGPVNPAPMVRVNDVQFASDEPKAEVVVMSFQPDLGVTVPATVETLRGSLLNFRAVTNVLHPIDWTIKEVFEEEDDRGGKRGRLFKSDAVMVDLIGGERQPFSRRPDDFKSAAEILILDRNGRLVVRNDMEDLVKYQHANFVSEANTQVIDSRNKKGGRDDEADDDQGGDRGR